MLPITPLGSFNEWHSDTANTCFNAAVTVETCGGNWQSDHDGETRGTILRTLDAASDLVVHSLKDCQCKILPSLVSFNLPLAILSAMSS